MKNGRPLADVVATIEAQADRKEDFAVDTRELTLLGGAELHLPNGTDYAMSDVAHRQIGERLGIPSKYYDRLLAGGRAGSRADGRRGGVALDDDAQAALRGLLDTNVNTLLRAVPERRMVRTWKAVPPIGVGAWLTAERAKPRAAQPATARAFVSERFLRRDNDELAAHVLPMFGAMDGARVASCEVTERHLHIKVVTPRVEGEIGVGDFVQAGVVLKNSEVGHGSLSIQPMIFRLICLNGMIAGEATRHYHVGGRVDSDDAGRVFSDETLRKDDAAFWAKVTDVTKAAVSQSVFDGIVGQLREASESTRMAKPVEAMERLQQKFRLTDNERESALAHLVEGGDLSAYGAMNAVTRASADVESYDRATELEAVGGRVLTMAVDRPREWEAIAR